jgi:cytochrome P450
VTWLECVSFDFILSVDNWADYGLNLEYNPRVFPSPEVYKPSRWYNATTDDAYTAFSIGPRACIGKKFALVEAVAFLANILRDYSVEPLLKEGQSVEEWGEKVLKTTEIRITLTIAEAPLTFRRR